MKRIMLTLGSLFLVSLLISQTIVGTTPTNKKVVLEEFTGIHCVYCPDGHKIAQQIVDANPGNVFAINIHQGGYATPSAGEPDFRTAFGDAIAGQTGLTGYPSGTVNRHVFSGSSTALSRSVWASSSATILGQSSCVNVACEATIDVSTRELVVHVEAYYTGNSTQSTNKLNVAIIQNNVEGPQTGGATYNPAQILPNGNYNHMHMLRHLITGQWGETITTTTTGSFIDRTYSYTLPTDINGVSLDMSNLEIVAFMAEGQQEILTGNECTPTFLNLGANLDVGIQSVTTPAEVCGSVEPVVNIISLGNNIVTTVEFSYNVNGGTPQSYTWTGSLSALQSADVTLPAISYSTQVPNTVNVSIVSVNGVSDENSTNDNGSTTFNSAISGITSTVYLDLLTDNYGSETSWELYDEVGTIVYQSTATYANNTQYNFTFNLTPGCYNFVIHDTYGDGICCSYGSGHYILTDGAPITIKNGGNFGSIEETPFQVGASTPPVASFTQNQTTVCAGSTISFTDNSSNSPTSWSWNFGGGASNSTTQNPTVTFNTPGTYTVSLTVTNAGGSDTHTQSNLITVYSNPTANVTATNVNCFGGSNGTATVIASGGTPGYNYSWQGGQSSATATGLSSGTYGVTVTDSHGCVGTASATVTAPSSAVSASISSSTNPLCYGGTGSATVAASGGTPGYTYLWQGGANTATANGLGNGTYSVTVTDVNSCTAITSVTISQPTQVVATISNTTNPLCNGGTNGSASVSGTGGTPGYTYLWQGGATTSTINNIGNGTYGVTVSDANGCTSTSSATITSPTAINAFVSVTDVSCYGSCDGGVMGLVSGGTPGYTYSWSNSSTSSTQTNLCAGTFNLTTTDANGCTQTASGIINQPSQIVITPSSTSATCNQTDGSASVSATGGAGNYTYLWQGGQTTSTISNVGSGSYNVTVTDLNGCSNNISVNVSDIGGATLTSSSVPALCYNSADGSATVVATGGTPGYTYLWSSGGTSATETGLAGGNYTVTVTDGSGCNTTELINVSAPTQMTGFVTANNVTCFGACDGSATIGVSGGTPGYSYLWSTSGTASTETNVCAGNISIIVTDANGCTEMFSTTVSQPAQLLSSITSSTNPLCNGGTNGSATVAASGGAPNYTYLWSSGGNSATETGLSDGTYTVTVTDANGCTSSQTVTITEPTAIVITPTSTDESPQGANNGTATATTSGGTGSYSFLWDNGGTTETITGLASGTYYVTVTDANGCTQTSSIFVDFFVSITDIGVAGLSYNVFPNPTDKFINLEITSDSRKDVIVRILNNTGQLVFEQKINNIIGEYRNSIDVSQIASGMYEFVIITENGVINKKVIKK